MQLIPFLQHSPNFTFFTTYKLLSLRSTKKKQALVTECLIFDLKMTPEPNFTHYGTMKQYTYAELKTFVTEALRKENPSLKPNAKNVGIWLKKNGYIKIRKQVDNERKIYYYR